MSNSNVASTCSSWWIESFWIARIWHFTMDYLSLFYLLLLATLCLFNNLFLFQGSLPYPQNLKLSALLGLTNWGLLKVTFLWTSLALEYLGPESSHPQCLVWVPLTGPWHLFPYVKEWPLEKFSNLSSLTVTAAYTIFFLPFLPKPGSFTHEYYIEFVYLAI